jgi:hypothetical protein
MGVGTTCIYFPGGNSPPFGPGLTIKSDLLKRLNFSFEIKVQ